MDIQPADIAIILVSLAACAYCFVLSRRLKALQDTRDGLGATIMALSKSIAAMSATTQETRAHAGELATRLAQLLGDAETMCARIADLNETLETTHAQAMHEAGTAHDEVTRSMREMLEDSKDRILEMNLLMRQMRALSQAQTDAHMALSPASAPDVPERSRYSYEY